VQNLSIVIPKHDTNKMVEMIYNTQQCFPYAQIILTYDPYCYGKGFNLRKGLQKALHDIVVFIDGDMDIHPRMIKRLLPFLDDYDAVVGSKLIRNLPFRRKLTTLGYRILVKLLFGVFIDTQTGIKVFKKEAIPSWETNGFAYDIEILSKIKSKVAVPVDVKIQKKVTLKAIYRTFKETLKIYTTTVVIYATNFIKGFLRRKI